MTDTKDQRGSDSNLTDEILFNRFKKGDTQAFDIIVQRYRGPIFSFILKMVRNKAEADDLFQDVFFKIIDRRDQFKTDISFRAWLYTISRNTCIDSIRKVKRRPQTDSMFKDEEKPLDEKLMSPDMGPQGKATETQLNQFLDESLKMLPQEQKETFYLKVKGEMTFEEIGEVMHCSVNTAKSRMRYALEQLRGVFKKRGYLE